MQRRSAGLAGRSAGIPLAEKLSAQIFDERQLLSAGKTYYGTAEKIF